MENNSIVKAVNKMLEVVQENYPMLNSIVGKKVDIVLKELDFLRKKFLLMCLKL